MTSDEEPSEDASAMTSPPKSRFDEFLERLDEREALRNRSDENSDQRSARTNTEAEAEADGWIWGSPKGHNQSRGEIEAINRTEERPRASESGEERIWDAIDEETAESETPSTAVSDISDDENEIATASEVPRSADSPEPPEKVEANPAESESRWEKLGVNLPPGEERSAEGSTGQETGAVDPTEAAPLDESTSQMQTQTQPETTSMVNDPAWGEETTDSETVSGDRTPNAEGALSAGNHSSLDRAVSAGSVLVLGPTRRPISEAICSKFLVDDQGSRDVLFVTFDESPDDRVDVCHRSEEWAGGEIGIIEVGRGSRSSSAAAEITGGEGGSITVRHVSKPGDLSKLGIVITQLLAEFDETPRQTVLCFHTLSALHNQVGTKTLFRFLNTLQGRLRSANAVGHYHMDPDLHDEIVIETLRPIFDVIVRYTADGTIEVE